MLARPLAPLPPPCGEVAARSAAGGVLDALSPHPCPLPTRGPQGGGERCGTATPCYRCLQTLLREARMAHAFGLCSCWSGLVTRWPQPALLAQYSHARQVSGDDG